MTDNTVKEDLQDQFISKLIEQEIPTSIYLKSGIKLHGKIIRVGKHTIELEENNIQLIYKHAVATIVPGHNIK